MCSAKQVISKNEQIRDLFKQYRGQLLAADVTTPVKSNGICCDGIVDEETFDAIKNQYGASVIFLLKETNGNEKVQNVDGTKTTRLPDVLPDWDYRAWLQEQQANNQISKNDFNRNAFYGAAFNKLCMWTDIFYDCLNERTVSFEEYKQSRYNESNFRSVLKRTGIINLKKTWGGETTEYKKLFKYLNQEDNPAPREILKKEIEIIQPSVVICGSRQTFDLAKYIFGGDSYCLTLQDGKDFEFFKNEDTLFIDFYHPSCRGRNRTLYEYAKLRFTALKPFLKSAQ